MLNLFFNFCILNYFKKLKSTIAHLTWDYIQIPFVEALFGRKNKERITTIIKILKDILQLYLQIFNG